MNVSATPAVLSLEQKRALYRDGYVVVRNAVAPELVEAALARIRRAKKGESLSAEREMTDLVNASSVTPILHEAMGPFDPPTHCQVGVIKRSEPGEHFNNLGYPDRDMPYYGAQTHMDGLITISAPQEVQEGTPGEIYHRYFASGPKGDLGRSPDVMGHNMVPMFQDPEMTLGNGSFTAFVFVCLSDQTVEGRGQTALLRGAHHATERFFRWQYETNGHVGPEGPGWPRINYDAPNRCGLVYLPEAVRDQFLDETSESTPDGKRWPRPTQILMAPGDACITSYHIPHSGTRNEHGTESRKNIIFRIRNKNRQPDKVANGVSDHPDRGQMGEWLEYEDGNDPWERSKYALCNMWHEWEGMAEVVAEERAREGASCLDMNAAATRSHPTTAHDVQATLRFGVDTGARQSHEIDPRNGRFARSAEHAVTVHDGRTEPATLDTHGFELLQHPHPAVDWNDANAVAEVYYAQVSALVLERTGGSRAFLFDHTVRHGDEAVRAARGVREPAYGVHNDYTHWSSRKRMRDLLPDEAETLLERRFAIVQVWRPIRRLIEADPIAIADARTIREADLIPVNRISPGRVGETWQIAWHRRQRFYWFPRMTPDEALLFKVYDSATDGRARFTAHTAFRLPTQDATTPPRESCEVRMFVFF